MKNIKVLLVEDESVLAAIIKESLETCGFDVSIAANGVEGWGLFNLLKPDVCIIDVMMPRKDGYALVTDIRIIDESVPVIFLTAKTQTADILKGFEVGGDDYMKKPFSMQELVLRLKALVRRNNTRTADPPASPADITVGSFFFNHHQLKLRTSLETVELSQREANLLQLFLENRNRLLDRKMALIKVWGEDTIFNARSMDVYVTRLRKLLRNDPSVEIINIRAKGYMFKEGI